MKTIVLEQMVEVLDLPDSAYEKAKNRYEDIGNWLERDESKSSSFSPHIFGQGSFRLGTAIKPVNDSEEYDLDLACKLREGVTMASHSQADLKGLLRHDMEAYREYRGISAPVEPKHRCLRLDYQDDLSFHIDFVPCIPAEAPRRTLIKEAMVRGGESNDLATQVAELAVAITDDRLPGYKRICDDWLISNPEGYARWFESRMRLGAKYLLTRAEMVEVAQIDDLPYYQWKTPLQHCVQLLKRHRDEMFKENLASKPISAIITTLAGRSYQGENDIGAAMETILDRMDTFIGANVPCIPNPANPEEDFADRWSMPQHKNLELERNFRTWLTAARADFATLSASDDASFVAKQATRKFALALNESKLETALGPIAAPHVHVPKEHKIGNASKPWSASPK